MKPRVLFATTNAGKLKELRALMGPALEVVSLADVPKLPEPDESGATFEANAELKARYYAEATGLPTLADDSGLCVDALNGAPGVLSARYAPGSDQDRNEKLLRALSNVPLEQRTASFRCALCLVTPAGAALIEVGRCEGRIAQAARGDNGFGYDPVFWLPDQARTMAELTPEQKAAGSHRALAFQRMRPHLLALAKA